MKPTLRCCGQGSAAAERAFRTAGRGRGRRRKIQIGKQGEVVPEEVGWRW